MWGGVATPYTRYHLRDHLQRRVYREHEWPELEIPEDAKNGIRELDKLAESQRQEKMDSDYLQAVQDTIRVRNQTFLTRPLFPISDECLLSVSAELTLTLPRWLVQA